MNLELQVTLDFTCIVCGRAVNVEHVQHKRGVERMRVVPCAVCLEAAAAIDESESDNS